MTLTITRGQDPEATRRILAGLPSWFGIPAANEHYVTAAGEKDSYLARVGGATVGVALVDRHFPETAEIHLIAVAPEHHGSGVGSALVDALESDARADGARLLEVKTVGPSHDDEGYAATRAFYLARGFLPLEEFQRLDWDGPTVIMVKPL
ncbi:MAG: GNAT family N-acetyltransferase [Actinomycetales bacterium]|nr:GNAT family N-acetyltransferase [Actinomycetales bacterium]